MSERDSSRAEGESTSPRHLRRVISVCEPKDIGAWKAASPKIVEHIDSEEYHLICPDAQIEDFTRVSHPGWKVIGESRFTGNCDPAEIRRRVRGENVSRVGWLLQQFIKINAIADSDLQDADPVLIWDADTIPLTRLRFIDPASGVISYYHSHERHEPYFETINSLFGSIDRFDRSFIAQCLPVRVGWVREMLGEIGGGAVDSYVTTILDLLPGKSGSEFSEYETIGTWVFLHRRDEVEFKQGNRWLRRGSSFVRGDLGGLWARMVIRLLSARYDFVAFERWRKPLDAASFLRAIGRRASIFYTRLRSSF